MNINKMSSMDRTMAAISHQKPDRLPLFLLFSHYGAKHLGITPKKYFNDIDLIFNTQLELRKKFNSDCYYSFLYASTEVEAFGGETIFFDDGPPNAGEPVIKNIDDISKIEIPEINKCDKLNDILNLTSKLYDESKGEVPIIGVVMSPFSLPVMQMGFEKYLQLIYFEREKFKLLMEKNTQFCINWANSQLKAGASAICYFNPLASPTMIERNTYLDTGYNVDKYCLNQINGPIATHLASGSAFKIFDDILKTKTAVLGVSHNDDLRELRKLAKDKICLLGNMNGLEMVNWTTQDVISNIKSIIEKTGEPGGLILAESHGEIPWDVSEDTLLKISECVNEYARYS